MFFVPSLWMVPVLLVLLLMVPLSWSCVVVLSLGWSGLAGRMMRIAWCCEWLWNCPCRITLAHLSNL